MSVTTTATTTAPEQRAARVLSVQSSVVYGYVGNKAATFPLQLLGLEVDCIHSVQLSNHTGYPLFTGRRFTGDEVAELAEGLDKNGFLGTYTHLLTGYMGSESFVRAVGALAARMRALNPALVVLVDPVMGDDGRLYVPPVFPQLYRELLVPLATVLTPNQTEAELLTEAAAGSIVTRELAFDACDALHRRGVAVVVITSLVFPDDEETLHVIASAADAPNERLHLRLPRFHVYLSGTGDLTAALLLANLHRRGMSQLRSVLEETMASLRAVMRRTLALERKELALVQSRNDFEHPVVEFRAEVVPHIPKEVAVAAAAAAESSLAAPVATAAVTASTTSD